MPSHQELLLLTVFGALQLFAAVSGSGYNYDRPIPNSPKTGHIFQPLATVLPLPPVPSLPPLPTPRPKNINSIIASYLPAHNTQPNQFSYSPALSLPPRQSTQFQPKQQQPRISPTYLTPTLQSAVNAPHTAFHQQVVPRFDLRADVPPTTGTFSTFSVPTSQSRFFGPSAPTAGGFVLNAPSAPSLPSVDNNNNDIYLGPNGRQLKQYAVFEIIDNDIAQSMSPFLPAGYFDSVRAQTGASGGLGANSADPGAVQFESRIGALVQQQNSFSQQQQQPQQQQQQNGRSSSANAISLGSGGLGYVRLPNGNVYLGSGSLGYISDQQHQRLLQETRTRTGARQPDALHFGHGPLGGTSNGFSFRFK